VPGHEEGFFVGGWLFDDVKPDMSIYREAHGMNKIEST
jgi:malonate-semialdehyde dehydrogenase (acetylating) / methylmalonate-semialdehyde dehydrogenase